MEKGRKKRGREEEVEKMEGTRGKREEEKGEERRREKGWEKKWKKV